MNRNEKYYLTIYLISFALVWLCYIFWLDKDNFDIEFRDKATTYATITNLGTYEALEELYDGRKAILHEIPYIEYLYTVDGKQYKYGSDYQGPLNYLSNTIEIEYVKSDPGNSRITEPTQSSNYFLKNLIPVIAVSFFPMFGIIYLLQIKKNYQAV